MNKKIGLVLAVASVGLVALAACDIKTPGPVCQVAKGYDYAAKYFLKGTPTAACSSLVMQGETIGANKFWGADGTEAKFAIMPNLAYTGSSGNFAANGTWKTERPNSDGICEVESLSTITSHIDEVTADDGDGGTTVVAPARDIEYRFKNARFWVTPQFVGTQFQSDLTFVEGTCSIDYNVVAVWPQVPCYATDADGNPLFETNGDYQVDQTICAPNFDGAGIGIGIGRTCDAKTGYCQLKTDTIGDATLDPTAVPAAE